MNESKSAPLAILCSGVALGVYNPGLILRDRLRAVGRPCQVFVLENLLGDKRRENIPQIKKAFHRNFGVALNSQKMTGDIADKLDPLLAEDCLDEWERERIQSFCVFSGFWLPVIQQYQRRRPERPCKVHLCWMDAALSTSWKPFAGTWKDYRLHRLFDHAETRVACLLTISPEPPLCAERREPRFVVHGGGWGMGTYQHAVEELAAHGIAMDVICYEPSDVKRRGDATRHFMIDSRWKPWERVDGDYVFPPFAEIRDGVEPVFATPTGHPHVYDLSSRAWGIISKPGGATLLDSFCSATPLIFMSETFGDYERKNGELWQALGFGMSFSDWRATNYSLAALRTLHENIVRYKETVRLPRLEEEIAHAA